MCRFRRSRVGITLALCLAATGAPAEQGQWARWLQGRLAELPDSRAIQARTEADLARSRALGEPLYNPSLNLGYENSAENTRSVGISQKLDWSGKGRAAGRVGEVFAELARVEGERARARLTAKALQVLVDWTAARAHLAAAREQEQRLQRLLDVTRRREESGDLGRAEASLAYLALARVQRDLANAESAATAAGVALRQQLAVERPRFELPDANLWGAGGAEAKPQRRLPDNYALRIAELRRQLAERGVTLAARERRTDPSVGLRAGREGDANLWGVEISVPLPVFNTGQPEYRAALARAAGGQAALEQQRTRQSAELGGAWTDYQQLRARWQQWRAAAEAPVKRSTNLLEQVWRQGEWTTQDYLQGLDQNLEARQAGIDLRSAMQRAWVRWLYESAALDDWFNRLAGRGIDTPFTPTDFPAQEASQ